MIYRPAVRTKTSEFFYLDYTIEGDVTGWFKELDVFRAKAELHGARIDVTTHEFGATFEFERPTSAEEIAADQALLDKHLAEVAAYEKRAKEIRRTQYQQLKAEFEGKD